MIGTPFTYHTFCGGTVVAFIGYELDYDARLIGLSDTRPHWLMAWVDQAEQSHWVVQVRRFSEFLGRLGFVSRVVYWIKPHLAPLYAWGSVASKSHAAKLPDMVILTLLYLRETLGELDFKVSPYRVAPCSEPLFYTDAKCADQLVVLEGWDARAHHSKSRWFSIRLTPSQAPYLFDQQGKSHWASAAAELLGTLAGLCAFDHLKPNDKPRQSPVVLPAVTDNCRNDSLIKKGSSTKLPLMLINMQLSHLLRVACLRLNLNWKPRSENDLADRLVSAMMISRCNSSTGCLRLTLSLLQTESIAVLRQRQPCPPRGSRLSGDSCRQQAGGVGDATRVRIRPAHLGTFPPCKKTVASSHVALIRVK